MAVVSAERPRTGPDAAGPYRFCGGELALESGGLAALAQAARDVVALVVRLARDAARDGTLGSLLGGVDATWLEYVFEPPDCLDGLVARPDLVFSAGRFQCLDVNAAHAGGWLAGTLWQWSRETGPDEPAPDRDVTLAAVFDLVHATARRAGVCARGEPVGLVVTRLPGSTEFTELVRARCLPAWYAAAARAGSRAGPLLFADYAELDVAGDGVRCCGERVHALIEGDVVDGAPRLRCFSLAKQGLLSLHSGPVAAVVNDRRFLAELSTRADNGILDAAWRALVRAIVPWTRCLLPGATTWRGLPVQLPDLVVRRREEMVVKQASSAGGVAVHLGWCTPPEQWAELVARAVAAGDWVVQQYLPPEYPPGTRGAGAGTHPVWGAFVVGGRYASGWARVLRADGYQWPHGAPTSMADSPNGDDRVPLALLSRAG
ncbi:hypothetical protein [Frankia sp. Cj5]|uniref:hypothetical protein n=1 Tax=Frankia sp. Cj5 TaxID=2880978 RepID=UPI001EF527E1|nr:hypothetical protein [Frankia sp. Cj5]